MTSFPRRLQSKLQSEQGFTLLEVSFVITIFAVMASIVLFRFKDFGAKTAFDNLIQDVALHIVQAQKSAISGTLNPNFTDTNNPPSYGMFFQTSASDPIADPLTHQFTYFTDIPLLGTTRGNGVYDSSSGCPSAPTVGNECLSTTSITSGEYVSKVCWVALDGTQGCSAGSMSANITFVRPFPDATIEMCVGGGTCTPAGTGYIEFRSLVNAALAGTIVITGLGEISVHNGPACDIVGTSC